MLLFNGSFFQKKLLIYYIQIHLMLLFNQSVATSPNSNFAIQIHLMLLFNHLDAGDHHIVSLFKYISCYYLTGFKFVRKAFIRHSNTSHVII